MTLTRKSRVGALRDGRCPGDNRAVTATEIWRRWLPRHGHGPLLCHMWRRNHTQYGMWLKLPEPRFRLGTANVPIDLNSSLRSARDKAIFQGLTLSGPGKPVERTALPHSVHGRPMKNGSWKRAGQVPKSCIPNSKTCGCHRIRHRFSLS